MNKQLMVLELEAERAEIVKKLNAIDLVILSFKQSMSFDDYNNDNTTIKNGYETTTSIDKTKYAGYYDAKSPRDKVAIILKTENRFLHMRQILQIALSLEPKGKADEIEKKIKNAVYNLKTNNSIISQSVGSNLNTFWGSKNWLTDTGEIKEENMYDESELQKNKKDTIEI